MFSLLLSSWPLLLPQNPQSNKLSRKKWLLPSILSSSIELSVMHNLCVTSFLCLFIRKKFHQKITPPPFFFIIKWSLIQEKKDSSNYQQTCTAYGGDSKTTDCRMELSLLSTWKFLLVHFVFTELIDLANYFMVQATLCFHIPNQLANPLTDCFEEFVHLPRKKIKC